MSQSTVKELQETIDRLENGIIEAVAEIDQSDGSRVGLQESMDSARASLETAYGENLTHDVNEFLGIENAEIEEDDEE